MRTSSDHCFITGIIKKTTKRPKPSPFSLISLEKSLKVSESEEAEVCASHLLFFGLCKSFAYLFYDGGCRFVCVRNLQTPGDSMTSSDAVPAAPATQTPPSVVEAYRAKVKAEQQSRQQQLQHQQRHDQHLTVENDQIYRRAESDYSIDNLSQLFNAGDDAAQR